MKYYKSPETISFIEALPFGCGKRIWIVTAARDAIELADHYREIKAIVNGRAEIGVLTPIYHSMTCLVGHEIHWTPAAERFYWRLMVSDKTKAEIVDLLQRAAAR